MVDLNENDFICIFMDVPKDFPKMEKRPRNDVTPITSCNRSIYSTVNNSAPDDEGVAFPVCRSNLRCGGISATYRQLRNVQI